jgi:serine/threonine protein kinase
MNTNLMESDAAAKHRVRMEREVNALRTLHHPNIPTLYDANPDFVPPYLVMTYVEGETYDKLLNSGAMIQLPLTQRLANISALADALDACHGAGIIHRDVKPSNMIGLEHPYLIDFGLAIREMNLNETMRQVGTLLYMTPDDFTADASGDAYSFAVVVYELLFGGHPIFRAEDNALGASRYLRTLAGERIAKGEWHVPSRIPLDEIPYDLRQSDLTKLDRVFNKAFSESETRYEHMVKFVADLKEAISLPQSTVINQPVRSATENMPTQLETPTRELHIPAEVLKTAPVSPLEAPVAAYTAPKRVQDQFTVLEVEKERSPTQGSRRIYWIAGVVLIALVVVVFLLATRT